jgi:hypothetical protein
VKTIEMFKEVENSSSQLVRSTGNQRRIHSIHGLLRGRVVDGQFEARGQPNRFSFVPSSAALVESKLVLSGRLSVQSPQNGLRFLDGVAAALIAVQGGVGAAPVRRQMLTGTAQTGQTLPQKMEQEKGPETDLQPGLHAFGTPEPDELGRPVVESTGRLSFVGVLYFQLSPLDGSALGVPWDLSKVQLNLRLATTDDLARDLQNIFSDVAATLHETPVNEQAATEQVQELNRIFKS